MHWSGFLGKPEGEHHEDIWWLLYGRISDIITVSITFGKGSVGWRQRWTSAVAEKKSLIYFARNQGPLFIQ